MLTITVTNQRQDQQFEHPNGPLEFGRGPRRTARRILVEDLSFSRDQLLVEELTNGLVQLENLSQRRAIVLGDGSVVAPGGRQIVAPPLLLRAGDTRITMERPTPEVLDKEALRTVTQPLQGEAIGRTILQQLGESPAPETLARWLETVIDLQRCGADTPDSCKQTARALVELIGLDLGLVVMRGEEGWAIMAGHAANANVSLRFSRTLVNHVCQERRTFYQDPHTLADQTASLQAIDAVVASPIFGLQDDVVGVLYGVRNRLVRGRPGIRPLEAQLVQLLAAAVGANLVRAAAMRTRVQFEQFFSAELVRQLEHDPGLLEGRNQEVTILVSDLRGFTALAERLGAMVTCRLIRDLMERLSERIAEQGGVIVDYAGDGILAMWNAPVAQDDHAARACRAALAMQTEMPGLTERWQKEIGAPLQLGIGLNTGPAQVGNTGSSRKFKYGPHGHTVNLASRVQDATKRLSVAVLINHSTRELVADQFATARVGRVQLAGVKDEVVLYELLGETATAGS